MTTGKSGGAAGNDTTPAAVDTLLQGSLGRKLRDTYQEVVNEEVPEKFLSLLRDLKKKESDGGEPQS
jgi:hypothetical protein